MRSQIPGVDSPLTGWGNPSEEDLLYPLNKHTNVYSSSLVVKSGPGILYGFTAYSSNANAQFILIFDAASLPADTAIPDEMFPVGATSVATANWIPGRTFHTGIVICNSSTGPTKTIGSADTWISAQFK